MSELEHQHRFCVTVAWMRMAYNDSRGYTVCNSDGTPNSKGSFVKRPSGKMEKIQGVCDHPEHGICFVNRERTADDRLTQLLRNA